MRRIKSILRSSRTYAIFVAVGILTACLFPEFFDSLLLGGSLYPLGIFQRLIIALIVGVVASLVSLALYMLFTFIWEGSFDEPQAGYHTGRRGRRKGESSSGGHDDHMDHGGHGQGLETAVAAGWANDGLSLGGETGASDTASDGYSDGSESGGFGGGDAGGGGSGGDFGGGDSGGGGDGGGGDGGGGGS